MKNKRNFKNKGITLIALVITIIILLILSGVAIATLTGDNGLFERAKQAKERTEYTNAKERVLLEILTVKTDNYDKENIILEIAKHIIDLNEMLVNKAYFTEISRIDSNLAEKINNTPLDSIVVSVDKYSKYKFLIGKKGDILGVTVGNVEDMFKNQFINIDDFEKNMDSVKENNNEEKPEVKIEVLSENTNGFEGEIKVKISASISKGNITEIIPPDGAILISKISENEKIYKITIGGEAKFLVKASNGTETEKTLKTSILENPKIQIKKIDENGFLVSVTNEYPDDLNVKYEYYLDNIKVTDKLDSKTFEVKDIYSEHSVYVIAYCGDTISKSQQIIVSSPYITVPTLSSNTGNIISNGFLEDTTTQWGRFTLFYAFDNNNSTSSSTTNGGSNSVGSYIGYDFGEAIEIKRVTGTVRMRGYKIQYSDDNEIWKDAFEENVNGEGEYSFDKLINLNGQKHRYWRIFVKEGSSNSSWSSVVYSLQFYGIKDKKAEVYLSQIPYLKQKGDNIINNGFYEDYTNQWGRCTLFYAFDKDDTTWSSTINVGSNSVGSYIGYDFGKAIKILRVVGKIRMLEYSIQYSDNNEDWFDALIRKSNDSENGDDFDEKINENLGEHRYWRIYVKEGSSKSTWSAIVYELQFYSK